MKRTIANTLVALLGATATACQDEPRTFALTLGPAPPAVSLAGGRFETGFQLGRLRGEAEIGAFSIGIEPVSVLDYARCVTEGGCTPPDLQTPSCVRERTVVLDDGQPAVCVGAGQAAAFCAWTGGALPTDAQWLYAARGPMRQRYAWGESPPTCEHHAGGYGVDSHGAPCALDPLLDDSLVTTWPELGRHPVGASPAGLQDVLLTPAELVRGARENIHPVCQREGTDCLYRSIAPGGVDGIGALPDATTSAGANGIPMFSFRCVHEGV